MGTITPTTTQAIRDALSPVIAAITPTYVEDITAAWVYRPNEKQITGLRNFSIEFDPLTHEILPDGHWSGLGVQCGQVMNIITGYAGLSIEIAEEMIPADQTDLFKTFHPRTDSGLGVDNSYNILGVTSILPDGPPTPVRDMDQGGWVIAFPFRVEYVRDIGD